MVNSGETTSFEFAVWKIALQCSTWLFHVIYRAPYSQAHPVTSDLFFQQLSDYLESVSIGSTNLLITGDFNIHVNKKGDSDCKRFNEILAAFNLSQFVTKPTHSSGNTLDLLITSEPNIKYFNETQVGFHISDHAFVTCLMGAERPGLERKDVHFRNIKSIDQSAIKNDLQGFVDSCTDNRGQNSLGQMFFALKEAFPVCKLLPFTANAPLPPIAMLVAERRHTCQLIYEIFISFQHCNGGWGGSQLEISSKIQSVS